MPKARLADLELRHLVALTAVAEEGTFGRAAARLGFTQSAVSQQIAALERAVGEPVFDRPGGPRPVTLTPAGRILLRHAAGILDRVRAAEGDLDDLRSATGGRLAIGTFQSVSVRLVPGVLAAMRRLHPAVELALYESDDQEELLAKLRRGELDVSFAVSLGDPDLDVHHLFDDPFVVLCPPDSPIVPKRGPVPLSRLSEVPIISQPATACQIHIERGLRESGVRTEVAFRTADNAAVQAMVAAGMGHAVMPRLAVDLTDPAVIIRSTSPAIEPRVLGLAAVAGRTLAPIAHEFIAVARRQCEALRKSPAA